ncbi:MAG: YeeE/YedE family protein [Coriobacteriales bacterium]|jgi:uncharacterized membrane protein YedE/YeeE|nr:YeeE/YedE family protein [Coriobacteriales bacterium]
MFREKRWSPWVAGSLLGVLAVANYALANRILSVSGGFEDLASLLATTLHLPLADSIFFSLVVPPQISFHLIQFAGMFLGALVASLLSGDFKLRLLPDKEWVDNFGPSRAKRWVLVFMGSVIIQFGAGIAGGCTSGLGISGTMLLAPSGLLFIVACFAAGILVTRLLYGRRY